MRPVLVGQGEGRQPSEDPEPDREDLGVRAPGVAPELRHHREREGRVADEDDEERLRPARDHELDPDDDREADDRRPLAERLRVVGHLPRRDAQSLDQRGTQVVQGRERVEEVPDRPDERAHHGHADPAEDPDEQRGDLGVARAADDPLDDDPQPGQEPERAEREAQGRRWQPARVRGLRALGPDVADQHEDERQGDGRRGAREVDRQRQPARVRRVECVRQDDRGGGEGDRSDDREAGRQPTDASSAHASVEGRLRRDNRTAPTTRTIASAATIGRITSLSVEPAGSVGPGDADGLDAGVGVGSGVALGVGSALADEAGVGAGVGDGVGAGATVNDHVSVLDDGRRRPSRVQRTSYTPGVSSGTGSMIRRVGSSGSMLPTASRSPAALRSENVDPSVSNGLAERGADLRGRALDRGPVRRCGLRRARRGRRRSPERA